MRQRILTVVIVVMVAGLLTSAADAPPANLQPAILSMSAERLMSHIKVLASDEFEGRAPGSAGEEKTVNYLIDQFKKLGLHPGNPDGSFIQNVPLVGFTAQPKVSFKTNDKAIELKFPEEAVVWSRHFVPEMNVEDSPMIFVGYGVVAPEYGWDDFKDLDVPGK